jgi:hypothetical protein
MNSRIIFKENQLKKDKSKIGFENLINDYFLIIIFNIIKKIKHLKLLNIIKNCQID